MTRKLLPLLLLLASAQAWATTYAYGGRVTLATASGGSDLTGYTAGMILSDASLKPSGSGGQILHSGTFNGQTVPFDLLLTTTAPTGNTCAVTAGQYWDIKSWDQTNGIVVVKYGPFTTYSHTSTTTVYFCYGSTDNSYLGGAVGAAYDANTAGEWGMSNGSSLITADSSASGNALETDIGGGYSLPTAVAGPFGGAASFTNYGQRRTSSAPANLNITANTTVRMLLQVSSNTTKMTILIWNDSSNYGEFDVSSAGELFYVRYAPYVVTGSTTLSTGTWYYVSGTISSSGTVVYLNGVSDGTQSATGGISSYTGRVYFCGGQSNTVIISEVAIDSTNRTAGWLATAAANLLTPATFAAVSNIGALSGGAATVTMTPIIM